MTWSPWCSATGTPPRSARRSRCTGASSSRCTSWPTSTPTSPTRRDIKGIRNLQEGRHALARKICHGRKGELYHRYERGLENQLGALGLVLNSVVLWTTVYLDAAVHQLRVQGYPVLGEDMARLSPFVSRHLGVHGTYSFVLPDLAPGAIRDLRDPDAAGEDDE